MNEKINIIIENIKSEVEALDVGGSNPLIDNVKMLDAIIDNCTQEERYEIEEKIYALIDGRNVYVSVFLYSYCVRIFAKSQTLEAFGNYILECNQITSNTRYFLYHQLVSALFLNVHLENQKLKIIKWKILKRVFEEFRDEVHDLLKEIPKEERNPELAVVLTEQFLGYTHAPTKIVLDRCKVLIKKMNKKVLLMNTAELMSENGKIPYCYARKPNYNTALLNQQIVQWDDCIIPFFQCENNMPDMETLRYLLGVIRELKPGLIMIGGGTSILANLINEIIPVLAIGMSPSDLENTMVSYQTLSRPLNNEDREILRAVGIPETSVIESTFTSTLRKQTNITTREALGLPNDKFVVGVVGYRLDADIDSDFLDVLCTLAENDICVAFIGDYDSYDKVIVERPILKEALHLLGETKDILSWVEHFDLYLNPYRKGGGTSSVEAMYKGIPVLTLPYGDVAVNVSKDFWVQTFDEMVEYAIKYKNDKEYYRLMSEQAKKRATILLDSESEFVRIIEEFKKRCD